MIPDSKKRFSNRVEDYVKYRPGYPEAIIDFLQQQYHFTKDQQIADIGAGTGISAELFLRAGYKVIAVEPNQDMREKSITLLGAFPDFKAVNGAAEQTGLEAKSIDVIISGQAFHWFDVPRARAEFQRILKKNGTVVLIWNERKTASDFEKEYDELIVKHGRDYIKVDHRNIDSEHIAAFFHPNPCHLEVFQNQQVFDFSGLEGRLLSSSYMPSRNEAGYAAMISDLKDLFARYQSDGKITIRYDTKVYIGKLKD